MSKKAQKKFKITTYRPENQKRIFSNFVEVTSTDYDISFRFADVKPLVNELEINEVEKNSEVKVPVSSEVVMPIEIAKAFHKALTQQIEKIEK